MRREKKHGMRVSLAVYCTCIDLPVCWALLAQWSKPGGVRTRFRSAFGSSALFADSRGGLCHLGRWSMEGSGSSTVMSC